ncbi:hypothetical protein [Euhalothece natronophila]|nr:hypothetical protein [Euhalothece natronophila]
MTLVNAKPSPNALYYSDLALLTYEHCRGDLDKFAGLILDSLVDVGIIKK